MEMNYANGRKLELLVRKVLGINYGTTIIEGADATHFARHPYDAALIIAGRIMTDVNAEAICAFLAKWDFIIRTEHDEAQITQFISELKDISQQ